MKHVLRANLLAGLAVITGMVLAAPLAQTSITVGETATVMVPGEGPENAVPVTLTINEPVVVTIAARSSDGTDPLFQVIDGFGRVLTTVNDNPSSEAVINSTDAAVDDTLLIPGQYVIVVGRASAEGGGSVDLSIEPGSKGAVGVGQVQIIDAELAPQERYLLPMQLQEGELVSFAALGIKQPDAADDFDLRMNLRNAEGENLVRNDDNDTFDIFLHDFDPRIYQFRVPETGMYTLMVRAFSGSDSGSFRLVIQRHGSLSGETTEVLTGASENRARNVFHVDFVAGEIVRITARAIDTSLDPELDLLSPDNVFIARNDDHGTQDEDLGQFDARFERVVIEQTGTHELNVNSVSGRGAFEVIIERMGVLEETTFPEIDASAANKVINTPVAPTVVPEVTAEPTA